MSPTFATSLVCDVVKAGIARPMIPRRARTTPHQTMDFMVSSARRESLFRVLLPLRCAPLHLGRALCRREAIPVGADGVRGCLLLFLSGGFRPALAPGSLQVRAEVYHDTHLSSI